MYATFIMNIKKIILLKNNFICYAIDLVNYFNDLILFVLTMKSIVTVDNKVSK